MCTSPLQRSRGMPIDGHAYFSCAANCGVLVLPSRVRVDATPPTVQQLRHHYDSSFWDRLDRFSPIVGVNPPPTLSAYRGLLIVHADRELIGAWNPML